MISRRSITVEQRGKRRLRRLKLTAALLIISAVPTVIVAQRIAIITPEKATADIGYAADIARRFTAPVKVLDLGLADAAFRSATIADPFNMTVGEAKAAASVIGCEYYLLVRTGSQRRASFSRPEYYEAFAAIFFISGRTGELVSWSLKSFEADDQVSADKALAGSVTEAALELAVKMKAASTAESANARDIVVIEEVPAEGSPAAIDLKPPIPYKRIKPEYTPAAFLYAIRATIEIEADIGADGTVEMTRIVRWAGYDLEGSVEKAVRAMTWGPAMRKGKPLPMRVLLRYNFTKMDKDQ